MNEKCSKMIILSSHELQWISGVKIPHFVAETGVKKQLELEFYNI